MGRSRRARWTRHQGLLVWHNTIGQGMLKHRCLLCSPHIIMPAQVTFLPCA